MSLPSYAVDFRGHPACPCQAIWLPAFETEAQRRGILTGALPLSQIIGGDRRSGGTHTDGGADDTYPLDGIEVDAYVALSREMGADATWHRPYDWDGQNGVEHVHRVLRDCPHNTPARYQIAAVDAGFNGLGSGGRGAPDPGPRPLFGRTWRQGIEWAKQQQEDDMADPNVQAQLDRIEAASTQAVKMLDRQRGRQAAQTARLRAKLDKAIATGQATRAELEAMRADLDDED